MTSTMGVAVATSPASVSGIEMLIDGLSRAGASNDWSAAFGLDLAGAKRETPGKAGGRECTSHLGIEWPCVNVASRYWTQGRRASANRTVAKRAARFIGRCWWWRYRLLTVRSRRAGTRRCSLRLQRPLELRFGANEIPN